MTWDDVAAKYGVKRCSACAQGNHTRGWARNGVVHWADRHITRLGLRHFLMLIASQRLVPIERDWFRIYAYNTWAARAAQELHIRVPRRYSDNDRQRVRWLITKEENVPQAVKDWMNRVKERA